jgi:hypothetical protein
MNFRAEFTKNKVGMEYEELTAAARYVDSEHGEPISSMKQAGVASCELCACAPCQCGKMRKTGGPSNDPFEVRWQTCFLLDWCIHRMCATSLLCLGRLCAFVACSKCVNAGVDSLDCAGDNCKLSACARCQCGKMRKTDGPSNDPVEVRCQACCSFSVWLVRTQGVCYVVRLYV